jgi:hypothetical protein
MPANPFIIYNMILLNVPAHSAGYNPSEFLRRPEYPEPRKHRCRFFSSRRGLQNERKFIPCGHTIVFITIAEMPEVPATPPNMMKRIILR